MISTIYSGNAVKYAITKLSPDIVILVIEKNLDEIRDDENVEKKRRAIKGLKTFFDETLEIQYLEVKSLYIYEITKDIVNKIDSIKEDIEIVMHISEGRKPLSFGLTFAAYLRKKRIKGVYYIIEERNEILKFPLFNFPVNEIQKELLQLVSKDNEDVESLIKNSKKSRSVVYQYIKDLEENGFIDRVNGTIRITELGKMIIL